MGGTGIDDAARAYVRRLHDVVDELATAVAARHGDRLNCARGCADCCVDDLTVFAVEADRIAREFPEVLRERPHPVGACAFLDARGACRVYAARPYVCRTQGLPLRYRGAEGDELRDICPLNAPGEPLSSLPADACWDVGPFEARLAGLQDRCDDGARARVALRSMFEDQEGG
jgi:hypothetical protein